MDSDEKFLPCMSYVGRTKHRKSLRRGAVADQERPSGAAAKGLAGYRPFGPLQSAMEPSANPLARRWMVPRLPTHPDVKSPSPFPRWADGQRRGGRGGAVVTLLSAGGGLAGKRNKLISLSQCGRFSVLFFLTGRGRRGRSSTAGHCPSGARLRRCVRGAGPSQRPQGRPPNLQCLRATRWPLLPRTRVTHCRWT